MLFCIAVLALLPNQVEFEASNNSPPHGDLALAIAAVRRVPDHCEVDFREEKDRNSSSNRGGMSHGTNGWATLSKTRLRNGKTVFLLTHQSQAFTHHGPHNRTNIFCVEVVGKKARVIQNPWIGLQAVASWAPRIVEQNKKLRLAALFATGGDLLKIGDGSDFRSTEGVGRENWVSSSVAIGDLNNFAPIHGPKTYARSRLFWHKGRLAAWMVQRPDWKDYSWMERRENNRVHGFSSWQVFRGTTGFPALSESERRKTILRIFKDLRANLGDLKTAETPWIQQGEWSTYEIALGVEAGVLKSWRLQLHWKDGTPVAMVALAPSVDFNAIDWIESPPQLGSPAAAKEFADVLPDDRVDSVLKSKYSSWRVTSGDNPGDGTEVFIATEVGQTPCRHPTGGYKIWNERIIIDHDNGERTVFGDASQFWELGTAVELLRQWNGSAIATSLTLQRAVATSLRGEAASGFHSSLTPLGSGQIKVSATGDFDFFNMYREPLRNISASWKDGKLCAISAELPEWYSPEAEMGVTDQNTVLCLPNLGIYFTGNRSATEMVHFGLSNLSRRRATKAQSAFRKNNENVTVRRPIRSKRIGQGLKTYQASTVWNEPWTIRGVRNSRLGSDLFFNDPFLSFTRLPELGKSRRAYVQHTLRMILLGCHPTKEKVNVKMTFAWHESNDYRKCTVKLSKAVNTPNLLGAESVEFEWIDGLPKRVTWLYF